MQYLIKQIMTSVTMQIKRLKRKTVKRLIASLLIGVYLHITQYKIQN